MLVDVWDPHEPWSPAVLYVQRYLADFAGERVQPVYGPWKERGLTERDLAVARALYAASWRWWTGRSADCSTR